MKRKIRSVALLTGLVLLCLLMSPALVSAQPPREGFSEDFESSQLEGWEYTAELNVAEGVLKLYSGDFAMKMGGWGNQTTNIRMKFNDGVSEFFIQYFARGKNVDNYTLVFLPDMILLDKGRPSEATRLGEAANTLPINTWIDLQIQVLKGTHTISVDGVTLITATDPEPLLPGGIGFRMLGEGSVEIDSIGLTLPLYEGQAPAGEGLQEKPVPELIAEPTATAKPTTATSARSLIDSIQDLFGAEDGSVDLMTFVVNLLLAVVLSFILSRVYIYWGGSLSNRRKFAANFILLTVTTTFIILVVRSSVALSLGLVGALSIVRFRTAVKEPEELAYLFFAISIGIGLGDNQRLVTTVAFAIAIVIIGLLKIFRKSKADVNLHLTVTSQAPGKVDLPQVMEALQPHTAKLKLMRLDETEEVLEAAFLVEFKRIENLSAAKEAVKALSPQVSITFLDNKGIW